MTSAEAACACPERLQGRAQLRACSAGKGGLGPEVSWAESTTALLSVTAPEYGGRGLKISKPLLSNQNVNLQVCR